MKTPYRFLLISAIILSFSAAAQESKLLLTDSLLNQLNKHNKAMGSLAIRQNGKTVYTRAIGHINLNNDAANPQTIYRLGSISKMYTGALLFRLMEKGKLGMNSTLDHYFPQIPGASHIQIRHLLNHSSGIFNTTADSSYMDWYQYPVSLDSMLARISRHPSLFTPGSHQQYSNSNFIILGYIIEKITGQSYQQNLDKYINAITGAKHTRYGDSIHTEQNEALSFQYDLGAWQPLPETHMSVPHGAGAVIATAEEVALFTEAYVTGKILTRQWTDTVTHFSKSLGYAISKIKFDADSGWGHSGAIDGFNTASYYFPSSGLTITFLSNGINYSIEEIINGVRKIWLGEPYLIPSFNNLKLADADLDKFKGIYSSKLIPLKITVSSKEGVLLVQGSGQPQFPMDAETAFRFYNDRVGATLEFVMNSDGTVKEMVLKQGGATIPFTK